MTSNDIGNNEIIRNFYENNELVGMNIDVLSLGLLALDDYIHYPNEFVFHLNNLLRSIVYFAESMVKNKPKWLNEAIKSTKEDFPKQWAQIKKLRDLCAHQNLIIPQESIEFGLFRIDSRTKYTFKLGMRKDFNKEWNTKYVMKDTLLIFHDLLMMHGLFFVDIDHTALGECLGITRRWIYKIRYKIGDKSYKDDVDVYNLVNQFCFNLVNRIFEKYAQNSKNAYNLKSDYLFILPKYTNVNTLLEIDLFPSLFKRWWGKDAERLSVLLQKHEQKVLEYKKIDEFHYFTYENLCKNSSEYKKSIEEILNKGIYKVMKSDKKRYFKSFILLHYWHASCLNIRNHDLFTNVIKFQHFGEEILGIIKNKSENDLSDKEKKLYTQFTSISKVLISLINSNE